jgi:hypothetical protein
MLVILLIYNTMPIEVIVLIHKHIVVVGGGRLRLNGFGGGR